MSEVPESRIIFRRGERLRAEKLNQIRPRKVRGDGKTILTHEYGDHTTILSLNRSALPGIDARYVAKITGEGSNGAGYYAATEQIWDDSASAWIDNQAGFTWDGAAGNQPEVYEVNGGAVATDTIVTLRREDGDDNTQRWICTSPQQATRYKIQSISNDYLVCIRINTAGEEVGSSVNVAKKESLRHIAANYLGVTTLTTVSVDSVTMSNGSTTETAKVTLSWFVGEIIKVVRMANGTGVSVGGTQLTLEEDTERAWGVE